MKGQLLITLCISGTFASSQTISQGIESTYDSPQGIHQEIKSITSIPEGVQWGDTIVSICAQRVPSNGTNLIPWFFSNYNYTSGKLMQFYESYYSTSTIFYLREDFDYFANGYEDVYYESQDSATWIKGSKYRFYNSSNLDSTTSYNWNAGMNQWILASTQLNYKGVQGLDSIKYWDPTNLFYYKELYFRSNNTIDSIVAYNYNGGWEIRFREIFDGNQSYLSQFPYNSEKRYWNSNGNIFARVRFDAVSNSIIDSNYTFFTGVRVDSTATYDASGNFSAALGYRYNPTLTRRYSWDSGPMVTSFVFEHFNLQGDKIGNVSFFANGAIRAKWGICSVYNSLDAEDHPAAPTLRLSPNPTYCTIMLDGSSTNPMEYSIFDIGGRELLSGVTYANELIDVSTLSSGTYIIISSSGDTILKDRFVKL